MTTFVEKLLASARRNRSLLCVGLDIEPSRLPPGVRDAPGGYLAFNRAIVEATADLVCAYKPNLAFYEALGVAGWELLARTLELIPRDVPVIADAKRGDVGHTMEAYARALFETLGCDAVTASPYLGLAALQPFSQRVDRGVFVLCRTSNPGAGEFQDLLLSPGAGEEPLPLYLVVARRVAAANANGNLGLVVGATFPEEIRRVRAVAPELPVLIPGVGAQSGDLERAVRYGVNDQGELAIINSSRGIIYASAGDDFATAARRAATALRAEINRYRQW
ncbi:MAG: orotidine-5'-phosphate decarboxylase [Chloroflexi bacterium]|nr:orotidine-5'-phosphate decarboxylase [Chloroflexota bacterium]MCL5110519.1 orotidine-5'-phosphate decarboxylase [Chloroflexota bacterium]